MQKRSLAFRSAWGVDVGQNPANIRKFTNKFHRLGVIVLGDKRTTKLRTFPDNDATTRGAQGWQELKIIKATRAKDFDIMKVKVLSFGLLKTNNITP
jgi:hypothetical protein